MRGLTKYIDLDGVEFYYDDPDEDNFAVFYIDGLYGILQDDEDNVIVLTRPEATWRLLSEDPPILSSDTLLSIVKGIMVLPFRLNIKDCTLSLQHEIYLAKFGGDFTYG